MKAKLVKQTSIGDKAETETKWHYDNNISCAFTVCLNKTLINE